MYHAILFDLDDTLYPYGQFLIGGFQHAARYAARNLGVSEEFFFRACIQQWRREGNSGKIFDRVLAGFGLPVTALSELVHAFRSQDELGLYPDAKEFLDLLVGRVRLGIVTDGLVWVQKRKIRALKIGNYFNTIVYSDQFGRHNWKPSPLPYLVAWRRLGSPPPEKVVYIGDNPHKDFSGAKKLGFYTLRLLRGQFYKDRTSSAQDAHACFSSFTELSGVAEIRPPIALGRKR